MYGTAVRPYEAKNNSVLEIDTSVLCSDKVLQLLTHTYTYTQRERERVVGELTHIPL